MEMRLDTDTVIPSGAEGEVEGARRATVKP